mmetsp:Transcript_47156/g.119357  ORF Transcript_47156/g.119357 Transcript_47156/m.119357 type:complete len:560 (+) Transcript_47156:178-1857(+)
MFAPAALAAHRATVAVPANARRSKTTRQDFLAALLRAQGSRRSPLACFAGLQSASAPQRRSRACVARRGRAIPALASAAAVSYEGQVLKQLERIIDPDFGMDVVACGFIKDLEVDSAAGKVSFRMELTTPACPVKHVFESQAKEYVGELDWVKEVALTMDAQTQTHMMEGDGRPGGLKDVAHVIAVSSCKGGVGKSTTTVNLAYTLAQMGAKVGIFDADVYGPSLPTMVSPELRVLQMNQETKAITPVDYEGVKVVSFGFAGQGAAIMRGPMVSGVIQQLLQTTDWGKLDYLLIDFPPGTGDIQLTLCQSVAITASVIVTTPQKLAFIDVAKGIRMFAKLMVPCVAVAENMSYFDGDDGKRYYPFGSGSGERIQRDYGMENLIKFPIVAELSAAGDGGKPLVVSDPTGEVSKVYGELGATVVREVAKLKLMRRNSVRFDKEIGAVVVKLPGEAEEEFLLSPALVRRNDTSAASINEWTGEKMLDDAAVPEGVRPETISPLGNYAVQITWEDGFNQVASFDLLAGLERMALPEGYTGPSSGGGSAAQEILSAATASAGSE